MAEVTARDISVSFGKLSVLENLSLDVADGEFIVLLGASGCGKSTLLNVIAGLQDVTTGRVLIDGDDVTDVEPADRGIAMVFQSYALYPRMSVRGNLTFGLKVAGVPKDEIDRRLRTTAEMLRIDALLDRRPAALSGGQRQRVAIGRAVVRDAKVFLFDEPLSNLDAQLRAELRVEIKRLHRRLKATTIYVTHDQVEAMTLADRIAVMRDRTIQQFATPEEIYQTPANRFVAEFVGSPAMNFIDAATVLEDGKAAAVRGGLKIHLGDAHGASLGADRALSIGIRPEHLAIDESGGGNEAEVDIVEPMGAEKLVWLKLQGLNLCAKVDASFHLAPGHKVTVRFPQEHLHVFDITSGERL